MITTAEFRNGQTILYNGNIYQILEFLHVKPGKGAAFVRTKLRNLRTGGVVDVTFTAGEKVEKAQIDRVPNQFLYSIGDKYVFMNMETFEQIELDYTQIEFESKFLYEGLDVFLNIYDHSEVIGIVLPEKVTLEVTETEPAVKGDTKTSAMKDAIVQTGLLVKVPLFVEQGERIIVSTQDGSYVSRDR
ncbi:MAG: elongation factor P [Acholeplasmataceae bacterium]|jgi:elongation factor P